MGHVIIAPGPRPREAVTSVARIAIIPYSRGFSPGRSEVWTLRTTSHITSSFTGSRETFNRPWFTGPTRYLIRRGKILNDDNPPIVPDIRSLPRLAQFCVSSIRGILITGGAAITVTGSDAVKNIAPCTAVKICVKSLHDNNNMNVNI